MEFIKRFFKVEERGSKISTELVAGLTTFLAMAYILPVNSFMLADAGVPLGGVFFATAVAAAIATLVMGIYANLPVALAPGMGLNAFFTYTLVIGYGLTWQSALSAVLISGILFFVISVTGLRKVVLNSIPIGLKFAVGAGIGFFITFIGLKNAGIIVSDASTYVALGDFSHPAVLLGLFGIVLVVALYSMGNRFALIISIVVTAIVGMILGLIGVELMPALDLSNPVFTLSNVFSGAGETFGAAFSGMGDLFSHPEVFVIIFTLLFVDFFDTAGTLMAVGNQAGLIDEQGEIVGQGKALVADSIGTMTGAILGTSNVTSFVESATGIEQGGRTGLSSVTVGVLFLLSIFAYPFLSIVNGVFDAELGMFFSPVTAMALVMVGALMVGQLKEIDWNDKAVVIPAFLTIIFMVLTFSIATGIAVGFVFYPIVMVAQGRGKEVNKVMYGLSILFILSFVLKAL